MVQEENLQKNCGPQKEVTTAMRKITCCAGHRRYRQNNGSVVLGALKEQMLGRRYQTRPECKNGIKDRGSKRPLYEREKRATAISIGGCSSRQLSPMGKLGKTLKKTLELKFVKRATRMFDGLRKVKESTLRRYQHPLEQQNMNWTLWKGRPLPKWKKKQH
jgi:hypothetical protein